MKKRKIVLGLAMAALTALSLSACDDASTSTPATTVSESGNGTQTTTGGNATSGEGTQTNTGGNTTGGEGTQTGTGGNTTGGEGTQTGTGGNTTGGEGTQTGTGGNNSQQQENLPTPVITNTTDGVQVLKCAGDQESLYAEFSPVTNADSYNVYVKGGQYNDFTKVDGHKGIIGNELADALATADKPKFSNIILQNHINIIPSEKTC